MLTLSGPKAMKPLPGKEPREDSAQPESRGSRRSETGDFEDGRGSSLRSDLGSDAGSTGSLVMRIKDKVRRKKPKVQPADFDELFARGLALSAQLESEQNKDP